MAVGTIVTKVLEAAGESMMNTLPHHSRETTEYLFGPFRFIPARRALLCREIPQRLGGRAIDILAILLERPSELVSKRELIARVWPTTVVEDGNLKVHVAALRRTLGEFQQGSHYISTINGRGYCFVAPVHASARSQPAVSECLLSRPVDQLIDQDIIAALLVPDEPQAVAGKVLSSTSWEGPGPGSFDSDEQACESGKGARMQGAATLVGLVDHDATQTSIAHVREQIGSLRSAVEVLENERDRNRKELQSLREQLEAAIRQSSPHGAQVEHVYGTPGGKASTILTLPMHVQHSCAAD